MYKRESVSTISAQSYRLKKINEIQKEIELERDKRTALCTKYRRNARMISVLDNALIVTAMGLSSSGLAALATVIVAPAVAIATGIAVGVGLIVIVSGQVGKKLALKAAKHEKIKILADAKLNTISSLVSKALIDNNISDVEYSLILSELVKFNDMKEQIQCKTKAKTEELTFSGNVNAAT